MEVFQIPLIGFLIFVLIIVYVELSGKDKTIESNERYIKRARQKIHEQRETITKLKSNSAKFSEYLTKEQIREVKGWSESQFTTMMWALRKEGYAKSRGKSRNRTYSIMEKK